MLPFESFLQILKGTNCPLDRLFKGQFQYYCSVGLAQWCGLAQNLIYYCSHGPKWWGWSKDFFGFEIFRFQDSFGRRIAQEYFLGWLDLHRDFFGVFKTIWTFMVVPAYPSNLVLWIKYNQITKYNMLFSAFWKF